MTVIRKGCRQRGNGNFLRLIPHAIEKNMKSSLRKVMILLTSIYVFLLSYFPCIDYVTRAVDNISDIPDVPIIENSSEIHNVHKTPLFCEDDLVQSYSVCNGFSNQMLGHAGYISHLIMERHDVFIPDAFILNGAQTEADADGNLMNVFANVTNSLPLTSIIDGNALLSAIHRHGVNACFVSHEKVVSVMSDGLECGWLSVLKKASDAIEMSVLSAVKPSNRLDEIVQSTVEALQNKLPPGAAMTDGVCLHHRDGTDWHKHCANWIGNNCMNFEEQPIEDLVKHRIPQDYPKKWMYYVGDVPPSTSLIAGMKERTGLTVLHRGKHGLLDDVLLKRKFFGDHTWISLLNHPDGNPTFQNYRDILAAVDFFVCDRISSFIGNSVSTFSAYQISRRKGKNTTWYNSRSNPLLATFLKVQNIPIVYSYTEESDPMGKYLLKVSITSARQVFGMRIDINILYHGEKDVKFLEWLRQRHVIIHNHKPNWLPMIDRMISNADHSRSHLYSHRGNYIGTWQRIDIPLFIREEYVLFLDADTVIHRQFDLSYFGTKITPGLAVSKEDETFHFPANLGVALFNVPKLRETYDDFIEFVRKHAENNQDFALGPSDQGAYLEYYHSHKNPNVTLDYNATHYVRLLPTVFNVKPYYKNAMKFYKRLIVHFHGMKPHDILKALMGYPKHSLLIALEPIYDMMFQGERSQLTCIVIRDFALALVDDVNNLKQFCQTSFEYRKERLICEDFFKRVAASPEDEDCLEILRLRGYTKFVPCEISEVAYLSETPEFNATEFSSGYDHYLRVGRHLGKRYRDCKRGQARTMEKNSAHLISTTKV